ncbi:protein ORF70 [Cyprinid herpesvirus 1]|uniref:Protein ORF70 n=1 Tax=Cyprinid herpesvirus 1 TaxID=317858 RepID=K7PC75_9VIRU|nr:protein ORF70 [Cyprinid herpesvirus 1]AFJ20367.1 protein ORF70 [Cyprinid herpesvirus 1]
MDEFFEKVSALVVPERLSELSELKRAFRGNKSQRKVDNALRFAAGRTAHVVIELERAKEQLEQLTAEKIKVDSALDEAKASASVYKQRVDELESELEAIRKQNAEDAPRRVHKGPEQPGQVQLLRLQIAELTRRYGESVEREAEARVKSEDFERRIKELDAAARTASKEHAAALDASKDQLRETLRLLNTAGSKRHMDFLPIVRGRSYKEVTLNAYLQFIRPNEQLYREKCGTYLTQGTANQMYDNACVGAMALLPSDWTSAYFVDPLAPYSMVHHYPEFLHYRVVLCNSAGLFAELLTVVQLNTVAQEQHKKLSLAEFKSLANSCQEPVRQFKAAIEIHANAFKVYMDMFVEYVRSERAATEPSNLRAAQYGPLENRFKARLRADNIEEDRSATATKRRRMKVDDLLAFYGAAPAAPVPSTSAALPAM